MSARPAAPARAPALTVLALAALALASAPAGAVTPSARFAQTPEALKLQARTLTARADGDSLALEVWWIAGPHGAPVLVMAGPGDGNRADLLPLARAFHDRGFTVLMFDYRDFGPSGPGTVDSLRNVVLASRWVDDAVGVLRFARARADAGVAVLGWGQGLGSDVMLAAAGRERGLLDGMVVDNPFYSVEEVMAWNGSGVIPDAEKRQRHLLRPADEPFAAAARLRTPVLVVIAEKEPALGPDVAARVFRPTRSRVDRWVVPGATCAKLTATPGYLDRVSAWLHDRARFAGPR